MKIKILTLLALLSTLLGLVACGEKATPTPIAASDLADITLVSFTSPEWGIRGVAPEGWVEITPGEFLRGMPDADPTLLQHQLIPDTTIDELSPVLASNLGLKKFPESVGSIKTADFSWDLYTIEVKQPKIGTTVLDIRRPRAVYHCVTWVGHGGGLHQRSPAGRPIHPPATIGVLHHPSGSMIREISDEKKGILMDKKGFH